MVLLLIPILVSASNVEVVTPGTVNVYTIQSNEIQILVKNTGAVTDTFYFSLWPSGWGTLERYWVSLDGRETITLNLDVIPPIETKEGIQIFKFTVSSLESEETITKELFLSVKRTADIYISEIDLSKEILNPEETLIIEPVIKNINSAQTKNVYVTTEILKNDLVVEKFDDFVVIKPDSLKKISHNFDISLKNKPGSYQIKVILKDESNKILHEKQNYFQINSVSKVEKSKEVKNRLFYSSVVIKVENKGNLQACNFYVTESLPSFSKSFFYPGIEPVLSEIENNRVIYTWLIESLDPGETLEIRYELRFTNVILGALLVIILTSLIIWKFFRPKLTKKYIGLFRGEEEVKVSLSFKNKERREIKNVIVKDFVPGIAKLIPEYDTLIPKVKREESGTELTWKVRSIKPKEERVFTYKIKPIIGITGDLKLPKASFMYETRKGKKRRVCSKSLIIEGKVK